MKKVCWLRRTGATTWRSFPPLQMIIAIIIVMFYSIFFCCSIWTLIRVCVGHSTSIVPLLHTSRRLTWLPSSPAALRISDHPNLGRWDWGGDGGRREITSPAGLPLNLSTLQLSPFHSSSSSACHALGFGPVPSVFLCCWIVAVSFFDPPSAFLVLLGCVAARFPLPVTRRSLNWHEPLKVALWGLRVLRLSKAFRRL